LPHQIAPESLSRKEQNASVIRGARRSGKSACKLKAAGFVQNGTTAYDRSILFLTRKGFQVLSDEGQLTQFPQLSWKALEKRMAGESTDAPA